MLEPSQCPSFCHVNHDEPFVASGSLAFGLVMFDLASSGLASSGSVSCSLAILVDCFRFGCGWCCGFVAAGCVVSGFAMAGSAAVGFEVLGWTALSLVVVRLKKHSVHCTDAV